VTGASTGIGFHLARIAGEQGYDLLVAADEPEILNAAANLRGGGIQVEAIQADLSTVEGNDKLLAALGERPVAVLMANAAHGLGHAFLDQDFAQIRHVIDTNVTGTVYLIHRVAQRMRAAGAGRILITGSIAGFIPGTFQAVYNATKAFIDSFSIALRAELSETGITVTCLMPGPTDTAFFERANMVDTRFAQGDKQAAGEVAALGFEAMLKGDADIVTGWKNKLQVAVAHVTPATVLAEQHRHQAEPGGANET
jgi:short-subunit dehydrogenase